MRAAAGLFDDVQSSISPSISLSHALDRAVRDAAARLTGRRHIALATAGLLGLSGSPALAALFPAEFELSILLWANSGDGSVGVVLNGGR